VESKLDLLVKGQESNSNKLEGIGNDLRKGFIGLALRNEELLKSKDLLKQQLEMVLSELDVIKKEREDKAARKKYGRIENVYRSVTQSVLKFTIY